MQLFILTNADGSPVADKSEAAVVSMTDHTKLEDAGELVLGDNEAIELKFTTATGSAPAFAGGATYVPAITLGTLTTDGSGNYAGATGFASITAGWSARIALTSTALISAINILGSGYGNPRGGWLTLQLQVTDPSGYVQTYAMLKVFVEWRVLASSSLEPLTPVEEVLANSANVAALKLALDLPPAISTVTGLGTGVATLLAGTPSGTGGLAGTTSPIFTTPNIGAAAGTTLRLTSTYDATNASGTTGSAGTLGGLSVKQSIYSASDNAPMFTLRNTGNTSAIGGLYNGADANSALGTEFGSVSTVLFGINGITLYDYSGTALTLGSTGSTFNSKARYSSTEDANDATGVTGSLGTLGGLSVKLRTFLGSTLSIGTAIDYADNADAVTAGLAVGTVYRTGDYLKIVHA
jgi:hypothetical protein